MVREIFLHSMALLFYPKVVPLCRIFCLNYKKGGKKNNNKRAEESEAFLIYIYVCYMCVTCVLYVGGKEV